jgi:hypothetical protein
MIKLILTIPPLIHNIIISQLKIIMKDLIDQLGKLKDAIQEQEEYCLKKRPHSLIHKDEKL